MKEFLTKIVASAVTLPLLAVAGVVFLSPYINKLYNAYTNNSEDAKVERSSVLEINNSKSSRTKHNLTYGQSTLISLSTVGALYCANKAKDYFAK
jgi:hypothetical protein